MYELPPITPAAAIPAGHPGRGLVTGRTPFLACRADQRFSYALHVPAGYRDDGAPAPLLVVVHGTHRRPEQLLDALAGFAEETGCAVMAPLFPGGIEDPDDVHNDKFIAYQDIRFDRVLLSMLEDVAARWNIDTEKFALHGFSGGGHFAHRFLYLHPDRLSAVSIGAPGRITLPDPARGWWHGVADLPRTFGVPWAPDKVAQVPIQLVIGSDDDGTDQLAAVEPDGNGSTRLDRLRALADGLGKIGAAPRLDVVPGAGHDSLQVLPAVREFLRDRVARG